MTAAESVSALRLIVVEDEAFISMLIEDMLDELGCVLVGTAARVADALALVEAHEGAFDGAILDVNLGQDSIDPVIEALAARGVPFVLATGYGAAVEPRFAAYPILAKPFQIEALQAALRDHVGAARAAQA